MMNRSMVTVNGNAELYRVVYRHMLWLNRRNNKCRRFIMAMLKLK